MKQATLKRLREDRGAGRPAVLATRLGTAEEALLYPEEDRAHFAGRDLLEEVRAALRADRPALVETPEGEVFLNVFNPPLRLVLVGAVHISQALAPMASLAGYRVAVVDPRGAFATAVRFSGVRLVEDWPDDFLQAEPPDSRTAVVTLTHDPKLDDAALKEALASPAFYIGSLGSRKTHAARLSRLSAAGIPQESLARISAPVGLAIGARTPAEIAIAILAEMTEALRSGNAVRSDAA